MGVIPTAAAADRWFRSQIFMKSLISKKKICEVQRPHASAFGDVGIRPSSRILVAEKSFLDQGFFGETISGITT
jgi:hypothetical protein